MIVLYEWIAGHSEKPNFVLIHEKDKLSKLNLYSKENERKLEIKLKRFFWYIFFFPIVKSYLPGSFWRKSFLIYLARG